MLEPTSPNEVADQDSGARVDLVRFDHNSVARLRLVCLPCAGGGPLEYRSWAGPDLPGVEVYGVRLPGRETRVRQPPFRRVAPLLAAIVGALETLPPLPLALFGHSMGALIAFELARRLRALGAPLPVHMVVASRIAPHLQHRRSRLFALPDQAFLERLHAYGGSPERVLTDPELMRLMMPVLRADFEVVEAYDHVVEPHLECPITAVAGVTDPFTSVGDIEGWGAHTSLPLTVRLFPGGHFFQRSQRAPLLALLRGQLGLERSETFPPPPSLTIDGLG